MNTGGQYIDNYCKSKSFNYNIVLIKSKNNNEINRRQIWRENEHMLFENDKMSNIKQKRKITSNVNINMTNK